MLRREIDLLDCYVEMVMPLTTEHYKRKLSTGGGLGRGIALVVEAMVLMESNERIRAGRSIQ